MQGMFIFYLIAASTADPPRVTGVVFFLNAALNVMFWLNAEDLVVVMGIGNFSYWLEL